MKSERFCDDRTVAALFSPGPTSSPLGQGPDSVFQAPKVEFIDLEDGAVIGPKTTIRFGLNGMRKSPSAGTKKANTGHFHLLIDTDLPPLDKPIPNDENHLHFSRGPDGSRTVAASGPAHVAVVAGRCDRIHAARLLG